MSRFKAGDKILCLSNGRCQYITEGRVYVVKSVDDKYVYIENDHGAAYYDSGLFTLVKTNQKPVDVPEYVIVQGKVQDVVAEVEQYLNQGYKLQGGVSMHQDWFAQAMILGD